MRTHFYTKKEKERYINKSML